jgi:hypothetical protein
VIRPESTASAKPDASRLRGQVLCPFCDIHRLKGNWTLGKCCREKRPERVFFGPASKSGALGAGDPLA